MKAGEVQSEDSQEDDDGEAVFANQCVAKEDHSCSAVTSVSPTPSIPLRMSIVHGTLSERGGELWDLW